MRAARRRGAEGGRGAIRIGRPRRESRGTVHRVTADVDGEPLWFESDDCELEPAPEAWASGLLIPALTRRCRLVSEAPLSGAWLENVERLQALTADWWGLPRLAPEAPAAETPRPASTRTGLCFTAGVDSLYNTVRASIASDDLVYVQGFNFAVDDRPRALAMRRRLDAVAESTGRGAVIVRTNLRHHPAFGRRGAVRGRVMGARLAAAGHVLGGRLGRLVISAAWPDHLDRPHGEHPRFVARLSSERVTMVQAGGEMWRSDRLRAIAGDPLVQRHLNVCVHGPDGAHCLACEKCVRTMLVLAQAGRLEGFAAFPAGAELPERLHRLPALAPEYLEIYEALLERGLPADLREPTERLVRRSRRRNRWIGLHAAGARARRLTKPIRRPLRRRRRRARRRRLRAAGRGGPGVAGHRGG